MRYEARYLPYTGGYVLLYETDHGWRRVDASKNGEFSEGDARRIAALLNAADGVDTATIEALGPGAWRRMWEACRAALSFWERYVDRVSTSESWASAVLVKLRGAVEGGKE